MRLSGLLVIALFALAGCATMGPPAAPATYVVRHLNTPAGERDPDLLAEGTRVAALLPAWFERERARPVAIYVSDYKRTRQTAGPLAERLGLQLTLYDPSDTPALIARVRAEPGPVLIVGQRSGQLCNSPSCQPATVLIVGHSNTVPDIIEGLGGVRPAPLSHDDFGDLWRIDPNGTTTRIRISDGHIISQQRR
jgi:phosphohistidine phosphatase SixA